MGDHRGRSSHGKTILTGAQNESISIRKIDNGWIITRTAETKSKGGGLNFNTVEKFTAEKPNVEVE